MTDIRYAVEETCAGALSRGACEYGVCERLWFQTTAGAGGISLRGPPGGVRRQVAFQGSHLVDPSCHDMLRPIKWRGCRAGGWTLSLGHFFFL